MRTLATLLALVLGCLAIGFALAALLSGGRERGNAISELGRLPAQTPLACREFRLSPLSEPAIGEARESSLCLASIASDVPGLYPGEHRANRWQGSVPSMHRATAKRTRTLGTCQQELPARNPPDAVATAARPDDVRRQGKAGWPTAQRRSSVVADSVRPNKHEVSRSCWAHEALAECAQGFSCRAHAEETSLSESGPRAGAGPARCPTGEATDVVVDESIDRTVSGERGVPRFTGQLSKSATVEAPRSGDADPPVPTPPLVGPRSLTRCEWRGSIPRVATRAPAVVPSHPPRDSWAPAILDDWRERRWA